MPIWPTLGSNQRNRENRTKVGAFAAWDLMNEMVQTCPITWVNNSKVELIRHDSKVCILLIFSYIAVPFLEYYFTVHI